MTKRKLRNPISLLGEWLGELYYNLFLRKKQIIVLTEWAESEDETATFTRSQLDEWWFSISPQVRARIAFWVYNHHHACKINPKMDFSKDLPFSRVVTAAEWMVTEGQRMYELSEMYRRLERGFIKDNEYELALIQITKFIKLHPIPETMSVEVYEVPAQLWTRLEGKYAVRAFPFQRRDADWYINHMPRDP